MLLNSRWVGRCLKKNQTRFHLVEDIRKRPNTRAKLIIFSTDTCACETCFIPSTNYFRDFARLIKRLHFSTHLIRKRYISQCTPLIIQGTCARSVLKVMGQLKDHLSSGLKRVFCKHRIELLERGLLPFRKNKYQTINFRAPSFCM